MAASYLPYEPQQQRLLPDALQDWLPEGHLAYFISDSVDSPDLSAFHARYAKGGPRNQPFHPAMMVKSPTRSFSRAGANASLLSLRAPLSNRSPRILRPWPLARGSTRRNPDAIRLETDTLANPSCAAPRLACGVRKVAPASAFLRFHFP